MRRLLTLAAAQALECNRCGDCCASSAPDHTRRWHWGNAPVDMYASLNNGRALIIPLEEVQRGPIARALLPIAARLGRREYVGAFTCAALLPENGEGQRLCALHDGVRPATCSGFPVFGGYGDKIAAELAQGAEQIELQTAGIPRCTWFDVVIVIEPLVEPGIDSS